MSLYEEKKLNEPRTLDRKPETLIQTLNPKP